MTKDQLFSEDMPAYAIIEVDTVDLVSGPFEITLGPHRLHCRVGRIRIHIENIDVRSHQGNRVVWATTNGSDHMVWLLTDLMRAHYDTPDGQAFLRRECARLGGSGEDQ